MDPRRGLERETFGHGDDKSPLRAAADTDPGVCLLLWPAKLPVFKHSQTGRTHR